MDTIVENIPLASIIDTENESPQMINKIGFKKQISCIIFLICIAIISLPLTYDLPKIQSRTSPLNVFSEERARDYLINLTSLGSRVSHSYGNIQAKKYILSQINRICSINHRDLQCEIDVQSFNDQYHRQLANILFRISNRTIASLKTTRTLLLIVHYDTVEFSPGISDDGSGIVILLELASNILNDHSYSFVQMNLVFLFINGEEMGDRGAQAFIHSHAWYTNIYRFINIDAIVCTQRANLVQMKSSKLINDYSFVSRPNANVMLENIPRWTGASNDYNTFDIDGYDIGYILDGYKYHTGSDKIDLIRQGVLQDLGNNLGQLIRRILSKNLQEISHNQDSFIYFDIFNRYLILYKQSTAKIIQIFIVLLILFLNLILIIFDHRYHLQTTRCSKQTCIYMNNKSALHLRIFAMIWFSICHILAICMSLALTNCIGFILMKIRPLSWYGNSSLTIVLYSLPCLIGYLLIYSIGNMIIEKNLKKINFQFERNFSFLFIYIIFMLISIFSKNRMFYFVLIWSIFLCPIYLIENLIECLSHWNKHQNRRSISFYLFVLCGLFPMIHTIEIVYRLIRVFLPFMSRGFSKRSSIRGNLIICNTIAVPTIFVSILFVSILRKTKDYLKVLIMISMSFSIVFIVVLCCRSFTIDYPRIFYAKHSSMTTYVYMKSTNRFYPSSSSFFEQSSTIVVSTFDNLPVSPILDEFSLKTGFKLRNKQCSNPSTCSFDDTFNRTLAIESVRIKPTKYPMDSTTILIKHALSYDVQINSSILTNLIVRNSSTYPRKETVIELETSNILPKSIIIEIQIRRCEMNDSPFLILFHDYMPHLLLSGRGSCQAINDFAAIVIQSE